MSDPSRHSSLAVVCGNLLFVPLSVSLSWSAYYHFAQICAFAVGQPIIGIIGFTALIGFLVVAGSSFKSLRMASPPSCFHGCLGTALLLPLPVWVVWYGYSHFPQARSTFTAHPFVGSSGFVALIGYLTLAPPILSPYITFMTFSRRLPFSGRAHNSLRFSVVPAFSGPLLVLPLLAWMIWRGYCHSTQFWTSFVDQPIAGASGLAALIGYAILVRSSVAFWLHESSQMGVPAPRGCEHFRFLGKFSGVLLCLPLIGWLGWDAYQQISQLRNPVISQPVGLTNGLLALIGYILLVVSIAESLTPVDLLPRPPTGVIETTYDVPPSSSHRFLRGLALCGARLGLALSFSCLVLCWYGFQHLFELQVLLVRTPLILIEGFIMLNLYFMILAIASLSLVGYHAEANPIATTPTATTPTATDPQPLQDRQGLLYYSRGAVWFVAKLVWILLPVISFFCLNVHLDTQPDFLPGWIIKRPLSSACGIAILITFILFFIYALAEIKIPTYPMIALTQITIFCFIIIVELGSFDYGHPVPTILIILFHLLVGKDMQWYLQRYSYRDDEYCWVGKYDVLGLWGKVKEIAVIPDTETQSS